MAEGHIRLWESDDEGKGAWNRIAAVSEVSVVDGKTDTYVEANHEHLRPDVARQLGQRLIAMADAAERLEAEALAIYRVRKEPHPHG